MTKRSLVVCDIHTPQEQSDNLILAAEHFTLRVGSGEGMRQFSFDLCEKCIERLMSMIPGNGATMPAALPAAGNVHQLRGRKDGKPTMRQAIIQVLADAKRPLHIKEIREELRSLGISKPLKNVSQAVAQSVPYTRRVGPGTYEIVSEPSQEPSKEPSEKSSNGHGPPMKDVVCDFLAKNRRYQYTPTEIFDQAGLAERGWGVDACRTLLSVLARKGEVERPEKGYYTHAGS